MDPYQLLSTDEMTILKTYYTRESDKGWTPEKKKVVAKLLGKLRSNGVSIVGLYPSGSLRFAVKQKSVLEQIMDLSEEEFTAYQRGLLRVVGGRLCRVEQHGELARG
jgi:hypothetical protein